MLMSFLWLTNDKSSLTCRTKISRVLQCQENDDCLVSTPQLEREEHISGVLGAATSSLRVV